jgi:acetamidase/formamidase
MTHYPVSIDGAYFSIGDTHAAMGDGEVSGTVIESVDRRVPIHPAQERGYPREYFAVRPQLAALAH